MSKMRLNNKAVSGIVAPVFLILIGIVSISIIYSSISDYMTRFSPEISCAELQINSPINLENVCLNSQTNEINVLLKRSLQDQTSINVIDFKALLESGEAEWSCGGECPGSEILFPGESKLYYLALNIGENPRNLIISINSCPVISEIIDFC